MEPKCVREWKDNFQKVKTAEWRRQKLEGGGRKCIDEDLEENLVIWIYEQRSKMLHVSHKMIMFKANKMFDEKIEDPTTQDSFIASRGWCENFTKRKTTTAQKDPFFLLDHLVSYVMHVRQLQKQH